MFTGVPQTRGLRYVCLSRLPAQHKFDPARGSRRHESSSTQPLEDKKSAAKSNELNADSANEGNSSNSASPTGDTNTSNGLKIRKISFEPKPPTPLSNSKFTLEALKLSLEADAATQKTKHRKVPRAQTDAKGPVIDTTKRDTGLSTTVPTHHGLSDGISASQGQDGSRKAGSRDKNSTISAPITHNVSTKSLLNSSNIKSPNGISGRRKKSKASTSITHEETPTGLPKVLTEMSSTGSPAQRKEVDSDTSIATASEDTLNGPAKPSIQNPLKRVSIRRLRPKTSKSAVRKSLVRKTVVKYQNSTPTVNIRYHQSLDKPSSNKLLRGENNSAGSQDMTTIKFQRISSATEDLVQKLKNVAYETGRRMTRRALMNLLDEVALTKSAKEIITRQLRHTLVHRTVPKIDELIESATLNGSALQVGSSIKQSSGGLTMKDALNHVNSEPQKAAPEGVTTVQGNILRTGPLSKQKSLIEHEIESIDASSLELVPLENSMPTVPRLSYGLERVLFNPGVYHLRDPRSRVFNFDPYLQSITPISDFDYTALKEYVTSSRDVSLIEAAKMENKKYTGSTSSMTSALAHFHFLLSQWRPLNISSLSKTFPVALQTFTALQRAPTSVFLRWRDGCYAIDADKEFGSSTILMMLGKSMEKLLTLSTKDYERYKVGNSDQISEEERNEKEAFHYTTMGDFLMRSQLDAYDPRVPGTGMFDLKTRAVVSIRMDAENYELGRGYEIKTRQGEFESYEREYYDMMRAAFLKYSLQVRMGRMDGIFVAFHNTERIFGFQYISLPEMDSAIHGTSDLTTGDSEFKLSLDLLNKVLDRATLKYPEQSLRLHFETRDTTAPFMYVFAEPVTEEEIEKMQNTDHEKNENFERTMMGRDVDNDVADETEQAKAEWEELQAKVEEMVDNDELDSNVNNTAESRKGLSGDADLLLEEGNYEETDRQLSELLSAVNAGIDEKIDDEIKSGGAEEFEKAFSASELRAGVEVVDEEENSSIEIQDSRANQQQIGEQKVNEELASEGIKEDQGEDESDKVVRTEITSPTIKMDDTQGDLRETSHVEDLELKVAESRTEGNDLSKIIDKVETTAGKDKKSDGKVLTEEEPLRPLLAMTLTIRNKVNGLYVARPTHLSSEDKWTVEYALAEVPTLEKAHKLYGATRKRKATQLNSQNDWNDRLDRYAQKIGTYTEGGREWRKLQDAIDAVEPHKVL